MGRGVKIIIKKKRRKRVSTNVGYDEPAQNNDLTPRDRPTTSCFARSKIILSLRVIRGVLRQAIWTLESRTNKYDQLAVGQHTSETSRFKL